MNDCIFCRILAGEIPSKKLYEDEQCLAFYDIQPLAPSLRSSRRSSASPTASVS